MPQAHFFEIAWTSRLLALLAFIFSSSTCFCKRAHFKSGSTKTMISKEDFLVEGLEEVEPAYSEFEGKMYAGTLPSSHDSRVGEMMFWLFEPDTQIVENSLVVWLNGGPGCSSFNCGVMMEHSPVTQPLHDAGFCCLKATPKLYYNEHTWTRATTMLYVEYPIGTGFSYGSPLPETEGEASGDLDAFLQSFYKVFDHLKPYDFFVFGESYAGMFVPSVSREIHLANKKAIAEGNDDRFIVPLAGASLGNGWVNGKIQGPAVIDYSWWHGLIDKPTRDSLHIAFENCRKRFGKKHDEEPPPFHPFNVVDDCGTMWAVLQASGNPNAYDITTWDPNVDQVTFTSEAFYNSPKVKTALHAPTNITWHGCRWGSGRRRLTVDHPHRRLYMDNDRPFDVSPYIAELLDDGIPVMVYNGDRDMTTNMVGSELILNQMEWNGKDEWLDAPRGLWKTDDYPSGWSKEHKGLTFVVVYNSGHMVPYNQPGPAFDLVTRFLSRKSFMDVDLPTFRFEPIDETTHFPNLDKTDVRVRPAAVDTSSDVNAPSLPRTIHIDHLFETVGVAAVSMFAGFLLALYLLKRSPKSLGYQPVPNASI